MEKEKKENLQQTLEKEGYSKKVAKKIVDWYTT